MARGATTWSNTLNVSKATALVTAPPLTLAAWVYITGIGIDDCPVCIGGSTDANMFDLVVLHSTFIAQAEIGVAGTFAESNSASAISATSVWAHLAGVYASATSRLIYLNGVAGTVNTTNLTITPANLTQNLIGCTPANGNRMQGNVAFTGIWNAALTAPEVLSLASGRHPRRVRPGSILSALNLTGSNASGEVDLVSKTAWTVNGTLTEFANPRVYF
jgi:hypothetical protein